MSSSTIVLVPGAFHGAWLWDDVLPHLPDTSVALELPSVREGERRSSGMAEDAEAIRTAVEAIRGPVTLVGHSYGGIPTTEALAELVGIQHVVYVAAFLVPPGASLIDASGGERPAVWLDAPGEEGVVVMAPEAARAGLYSDADDATAERFVARMQPQSLGAFDQPLTASVPSPEEVPSTYVVCTEDRALPPEQQEQLAAQCGGVERLASGHLPMVSHPEELAAIIAARA